MRIKVDPEFQQREKKMTYLGNPNSFMLSKQTSTLIHSWPMAHGVSAQETIMASRAQVKAYGAEFL